MSSNLIFWLWVLVLLLSKISLNKLTLFNALNSNSSLKTKDILRQLLIFLNKTKKTRKMISLLNCVLFWKMYFFDYNILIGFLCSSIATKVNVPLIALPCPFGIHFFNENFYQSFKLVLPIMDYFSHQFNDGAGRNGFGKVYSFWRNSLYFFGGKSRGGNKVTSSIKCIAVPLKKVS